MCVYTHLEWVSRVKLVGLVQPTWGKQEPCVCQSANIYSKDLLWQHVHLWNLQK